MDLSQNMLKLELSTLSKMSIHIEFREYVENIVDFTPDDTGEVGEPMIPFQKDRAGIVLLVPGKKRFYLPYRFAKLAFIQ